MSRKHDWNAQGYQTNAGFVPKLGRPVLDLLKPQAGERILDLGCGVVALTQKLVAAGVEVIAFDASPEMITAAAARGLDAHVADLTALTFEREFDAVFTNVVLHWVRDADAAVAGVTRALKPGEQFVGEFGGHGNMAAVVTALGAVLKVRGIDVATVNPWFYPTSDAYQERLEKASFTVESIALIPQPTPLPKGMTGWLTTFAGLFFAALPGDKWAKAQEETVDLQRHSLGDHAGNWTTDYVRLRFAATLSR